MRKRAKINSRVCSFPFRKLSGLVSIEYQLPEEAIMIKKQAYNKNKGGWARLRNVLTPKNMPRVELKGLALEKYIF